ncbi:hypothetical protein HY571_00425 [Candidatus Micrarchaeota archaeon]|nr:hypothetical protein [Candidatus Micrarchaeota archaeon]
MKGKTIREVRAALTKPVAKVEKPNPVQTVTKKTFMTVPYYTPSDDVNLDNLTEREKKALIRKGKLMGTGDPITITRITNRKEALGTWMSPNDFTYDNGTTYKAWVYTWAYLGLTVLTYLLVHPLIAVVFAWKTGHNWGQYIGALIFGKEDMKGKTMFRTA